MIDWKNTFEISVWHSIYNITTDITDMTRDRYWGQIIWFFGLAERKVWIYKAAVVATARNNDACYRKAPVFDKNRLK